MKKCVDQIRTQYRDDWKSKEMRIRQRAVALYFIDKVNKSKLEGGVETAYSHLDFIKHFL